MNTKHSSLWYLFAVVFTLAALFIYPYLPQQEYLVFPKKEANIYTSYDGEYGGKSSAHWLDDEHTRWECMLVESNVNEACSFGIHLYDREDNWIVGQDFSHYEHLEVELVYTGDANSIRLNMRNFDPEVGSNQDYNSAQFMHIIIRKEDLKKPLVFNLNEFTLADWWRSLYKVPRSRPQFDHLITLGFDFGANYPTPFGKHHVEVKRIAFTGVYIQEQHWYLGIILIWMLGIATHVSIQLKMYYRHAKLNEQRLQEISTYAESLKQQSETYKNLSKTDALTNTLNRFGLQEVNSNFIKRREKVDILGVMLVDIDLFKCVNDIFGHDVGDQVLISVGALLTDSTRSIDSVARWGGEEFVILCPQTDMKNLYNLAEKIRHKIEALNFPMHPKLSVTASFGLAIMYPDQEFEQVFKRADEALYKAKAQGRNCCVLDGNTPHKLLTRMGQTV